MAETFVRFSRDRTFQLITPKEYLHIWDVDHALSASDQELVREGYWMNFGLFSGSNPSLTLCTSNAWSNAEYNIGTNPRCVFVDADRPDVDFSGKLPIIMGFGWVARTAVRTEAEVLAGNKLTVDVGTGSDATGNYGHLRTATTGEVVVAHVLSSDSTWITFEAVPPYSDF